MTARLRRALGAAVAAAAIVTLMGGTAQATPVRGDTGWSVLLCKFSDRSAEPQTPGWFSLFATTAGNGLGGLADYWRTVSYGRISLTGSSVHGWYRMPFTLAQEQGKSRGQRIQDCVDTARNNGWTVPAGHRTMAITNAALDAGSAGGRVLLDPNSTNVAFAAHEMGHGYGLGHSFSNDTSYQNASWSQPGEYDDPWDEMSAMNVYGWTTTRYGNGGVGLSAHHLDELGWLPRTRIVTVGSGGELSRTVTMAPLEVPSATGPLLVRVPFDPADLFHYYTVELRKKTGWSRGIPGDTVLIHEVRDGTPTLLRQLGTAGRNPVQSLNANGVTITINWLSGNNASVTIRSAVAQRCLQGYVWREAVRGDLVCVTPATRSRTWYDNSQAQYRINPDGPYGPDTCVQGYVWREAVSGDHVCVTPDIRSQAQADNAAAASRHNPARLVYGPNTCKAGYVWREADGADYACVTPATRAQVAYDNAHASSRWTNGAYGAQTCVSGYVWREAFPADRVCVTPAIRSQTRTDNTQITVRVLRPGG
jgi:hypothetical protein